MSTKPLYSHDPVIQAACERRVEMENAPMPHGMRALTAADHWQEGDEYLGSTKDGWWKVGGPHTSCKPGTPVDSWVLCYHPRGSTKRLQPPTN